MENSGIGWTDNTFNYIWGCQKVAQECKFCYAEKDAKRHQSDKVLWGPVETSTRLTLSEHYWQQPFKWERAAIKAGKPIKVFTSSMADICEDHPIANGERPRLLHTIEQTPHLTWQLLTKRPENYTKMFWEHWPAHVWAMTSAGSLKSAQIMIPELMKVDAPIRGISVEPFIENFDITPYLPELDWVIIGGESGPNARPMDRYWAEQMIDACQLAGVAVFMKQMGSNWSSTRGLGFRHGTNMQEWPEALRVQQFPAGPRANRRTPYTALKEKSGVAL